MRVKKAIRIFEKIRDLPYGTSGSDEVWSCYQKCVLLKQELQHIGITSQLLIGVFDWQDLPIPERILNLRRQRHERHVILRVFIDGSTYDIDPSIDIGLAPTLPINSPLGWHFKHGNHGVTQAFTHLPTTLIA